MKQNSKTSETQQFTLVLHCQQCCFHGTANSEVKSWEMTMFAPNQIYTCLSISNNVVT